MIKISLLNKQGPEFPGPLPWYDTKEGIAEAITSLEGLNNLARERHIAGYDRGECLGQFYIMNGRYSMDTCGNFCTVGGIPKGVPFSDIPTVLTHEEFFEFLKERTGKDHSICSSLDGGQLPRADLLCPHCGKGWDIGNCHDVVSWRQDEVINLVDFAGKTLAEVKLAYAQKTDAIYFMQPDIFIRHDRFVDPSPKYPDTEKEWQKDIVVNEKGWVGERDGISNDYVIQAGDEGFFNVWKYFHGDCHLKSVADDPEFLGENGHFKNMAGAAYVDVVIEKELKDAGIEIVKGDKSKGEVPFTITGKLGAFTFVRAWTYWMVDCMMPLDAANEMYEDEIGAKVVRVAGHCGCPSPEGWAVECAEGSFIQSYHIDTMPGLKLFVETTKKYGLA